MTKLNIPTAIVIAGALVAVALYFGVNNQTSTGVNQLDSYAAEDTTSQIREVTKDDHIKGNPNAKVMVVEYSDFECPFCSRFHDTMNAIMDEEGDSGDVAWVYRHFPLDQLHPLYARRAAVASECVNELGGNNAFWTFTDGYFAMSPANDQTDYDALVPELVAKAGVDKAAFDSCVASGKYDEHVQDDVNNGIATGGQGTPWSIVVAPNGTTFPLSGAQPADSVKQLIEIAKKEK